MAFYLRLVALIFVLPMSLSSYAQEVCDCVNTGNCPVPITDNGTYQGTLDVTVDGVNDLDSCQLTSVCFSITHTWIGDLSVALTSPGGETYLLMADVNNNYGGCGMQQDNIDICIVPGTFNPVTNNSEYVCNPGPCSSPGGVCCLTGDYTVACGGVTDPINGALQAPNCDLNDFNTSGSPANGTWTLSVVDVCNMDTGTLDNFSLTFSCGVQSCIVCEADGGTIDSIEITSCFGDPDLQLDLTPTNSGTLADTLYDYGYIISQNGVVLAVDNVADLTSQPPGTYHVFGLSYLADNADQLSGMIGLDTATVISQLASSTAPFCGDLSDNFIPVIILPAIPVTVLNETVCEGECVTVGSQQICATTTVVLESIDGCDSTIDVNLNFIIPDTVDFTAVVCESGCVDIGGNQYCAPGQYFVSLTNVEGCDSVVNLTFNEIIANAVINPAAPPALTCTDSTVTLDGSGSLGDIYEWTGPNGFTSDEAIITVTEPGDYTLTVYNNTISPACQASTTVNVADGFVPPLIGVMMPGSPPRICLGETFDLESLPVEDDNNTGATITFHSGTPATPANQLNSVIVSPTGTTTYYILGKIGSCSDETLITLNVFEIPTSDFTATGNICSSGEATVTYDGTASPSADYTWDFDGGTASPGTGAGPHTVSWPNAGIYTISLVVEENGCTSPVFTQEVTVEEPLNQPIVQCNPTTSTITFEWADVPGSVGYEVNVVSGAGGNPGAPGTDPNTYVFQGLAEGQSVTVEIVALGAGLCGNSSNQVTCSATNCPPAEDIGLTIDPVPDICLINNTPAVVLNATAPGGNGNGTFLWSGQGITNAGNFDPELGQLGSNILTVSYFQENCIYTESIEVFIYETPLVAIDIPYNICSGAPVPVSFAGIADPGSTYTWDFEGGTVVSGSGPGPIEVLWPVGGDYNVTLTVESPAGCISETIVQAVTLATPLADPAITCESNTSGVTFRWPIDPEASSYDVNIPNGFVYNDNSTANEYIIEVINLSPGTVVPIEIEAIGAVPCGNNTFQTSCEVESCPSIIMSIDPVSDICLNAATAPFNLSYTVTGDTTGGILSWSGSGVDNTGFFDPSQANLGANLMTLTYEEGSCFFVETIMINVFETPVADFTADAAVCAGDAITVTYTGTNNSNLNYTWNFDGGNTASTTGPGPHDVSWLDGGNYTISLQVENVEGCISETATFDVFVEDLIQAPTISCSATTTSVQFSWNSVPGVVDSMIAVSVPQSGDLVGTTYTLNNLQPGTPVDFELTLTGAGICQNVVASFSCASEECPDVTVDIDPVDKLCLGADSPVQLVVVVTGSDGTGTGAWSGSGVDPNTGIFDPLLAGVNDHEITYTFIEQSCTYESSILIKVDQQPSASFTADALVCIADGATVTFNGIAGDNGIYNWNFDGGTASPGTGPGPHQVTWDIPGNKVITLTVDNNGCVSEEFSQQLQVDDELSLPMVSCSSTTESVMFSWSNVPDATGYEVEIISQGLPAQTITDSFFIVDNLDPGEEVILQITPLGNTICAAQPSIMNCFANLCSDVTVEVLPVDPLCFTPDTDSVTLQAIVSDNTGIGSWSGDGIIDPSTGVFDPLMAGVGVHTVTYNYALANCDYEANVQIEVASPPVADAGEDATLTCWESEMSVRLGGDDTTLGPNVILEWTTASGDLPDNATILRPEVSVPGTYTLTVTDVLLGCSSSDEVVVTSLQDVPEATVSISPSDCSGTNATMSVDQVNGGLEPYLFSLNSEPFVAEDTFAFLTPGLYTLSVMDAVGCESELEFEVENGGGELSIELTANLVGRNHVDEGESVQLIALLNVPLGMVDSVVWSHPELLSCSDCLNPMATPLDETTFTVTVYRGGCETSDEITIYVEYKSAVYVPNAFSPNGDDINDLFEIYAGPRVIEIKSFMVFDRWGEMVFNEKDFPPNEPPVGWDGTLDGKEMQPAVYVWMAEIELIDGTTEVLNGEVSLIR
ncbi:MAG: PKD domain-containing protein [Bacteroidota bacterium]